MRIEQFIEVVKAATELGISKIRLTGGEPLVRKGIVDLVRGIASVPGIEKVAMTTNGLLLQRLARPLREAGLTHLNVSLDTLDPEAYSLVTRGGSLQDALAGVMAAKDAGLLGIKVNTVVTEAAYHPEELAALESFCEQNGFELQRIAEYSLSEEKRDTMHFERPLPCSECNRVRLLSSGKLKPCLHSDIEIPVDFNNITESLRQAILAKPEVGTTCTNRSMVEIGG
jgi:cyclic pyranopterin phosphate synthase